MRHGQHGAVLLHLTSARSAGARLPLYVYCTIEAVRMPVSRGLFGRCAFIGGSEGMGKCDRDHRGAVEETFRSELTVNADAVRREMMSSPKRARREAAELVERALPQPSFCNKCTMLFCCGIISSQYDLAFKGQHHEKDIHHHSGGSTAAGSLRMRGDEYQ